MCGLLRCKEGNNICNFPYRHPISWLHSQLMGFGDLKEHNVLRVSELSSLLYYSPSQST